MIILSNILDIGALTANITAAAPRIASSTLLPLKVFIPLIVTVPDGYKSFASTIIAFVSQNCFTDS